MWFEIYRSGKLIKRGDEVIGDISWTSELMSVSNTDITLPIDYLEWINGREEIKIFVNDKVFWGIITGVNLNKEDETMSVNIDHIIHEWTYRQISVNNAIKGGKINFVFKEGADRVREADGISIAASNFTCLPTATNFVELAKVSAWYSDPSSDNYGDSITTFSYKIFTRKEIKDEETQEVTGYEYTEISKLPTPDGEDGSETVYMRFYPLGGNPYVQVDVTVKNKLSKEDTSEDNGETDIRNANVIDQLSDIYDDANFAYPGWNIAYEEDAADASIDYVYSRQNKLEALNKTIELTPDLWWRTPFVNQRLLEVGKFGKKQPYTVSLKREGETNICIIEEPTIEYDFKNVVNVASVYSEKSDTGMSSLTLREIYNDQSLQEEGFPVVILRANVNNERDYRKYITTSGGQHPVIAPNNELEYAVIDEESVALEDGHLIEGTYAFTDLSAFQPEEDDEGNTKEVTDEDRIKAATEAYHGAIRKLKQDRRSYKINLVTTPLPPEVQVGDKVRLMYDNVLYKLAECNDYMKFILSSSDYGKDGDNWFYITKIRYDIGENEMETDEVTLEYFLKLDRETKEAV